MRNTTLSLAALPPRRALQRPCRRGSLAFALMCLALAARHTCGEGDGLTRHPEDVAAAGRESASCTAVEASTPTGQRQDVFDWEGDPSALRDWLVEKEFHYSDGVVRGVPCASRAEAYICTYMHLYNYIYIHIYEQIQI